MTRKKTRIRRITDIPSELLPHLHPSLRSIVESKTHGFKVKRATWLKLRNRVLHYRPHARVFPWYCETCTLSSRYLSVIQEHSCPNKNLSRHVQDFSNEQRIAPLGFRSKAKDALAVLERVTNPQAIDIGRVCFPVEEFDPQQPVTNVVPRLSEICLAVLSPRRAVTWSHLTHSSKHPFIVKKGSYRYRHKKRTGQLCTVCRRLFPIFMDYEDHLRNGSCANEIAPDPVPIHMSDSGNVPPNYDFAPQPKVTVKLRLMICSLCHEDRFSSTADFHEHIIDCARKLAACDDFLRD